MFMIIISSVVEVGSYVHDYYKFSSRGGELCPLLLQVQRHLICLIFWHNKSYNVTTLQCGTKFQTMCVTKLFVFMYLFICFLKFLI